MKITLNKKILESVSENKKEIALDEFDIKILEILSEDSRIGYAELAERIALSRDGIKYRIKRLIEKGCIKEFNIAVNPSFLGFNNEKIIMISFSKFDNRFTEEFTKFIEKSEFVVYHKRSFGQFDYILDIISRDDNHAASIINEIKVRFQEGIKEMHVLSTVQNG